VDPLRERPGAWPSGSPAAGFFWRPRGRATGPIEVPSTHQGPGSIAPSASRRSHARSKTRSKVPSRRHRAEATGRSGRRPSATGRSAPAGRATARRCGASRTARLSAAGARAAARRAGARAAASNPRPALIARPRSRGVACAPAPEAPGTATRRLGSAARQTEPSGLGRTRGCGPSGSARPRRPRRRGRTARRGHRGRGVGAGRGRPGRARRAARPPGVPLVSDDPRARETRLIRGWLPERPRASPPARRAGRARRPARASRPASLRERIRRLPPPGGPTWWSAGSCP
jgi:hypothetical protein